MVALFNTDFSILSLSVWNFAESSPRRSIDRSTERCFDGFRQNLVGVFSISENLCRVWASGTFLEEMDERAKTVS